MSELKLPPVRAHDTPHARPASPTHDFFQLFFESADMYSGMWQPLLKSVGRWHLEVAGLGMKQAQASLQLSRDLARSWTAGDAVAANVRYWDAVTSHYSQSSQRLAATVQRTVEAPFVPEVVPMPSKRGHDMIVLPEAGDADARQPVRKVA